MMRITFLLLFSLRIVSCAVHPFPEHAEKQFRELIDHQLPTDQLILTTDRVTYRPGSAVHFWIENKTDQEIWFPDGSFAAEGYRYDTGKAQWEKIDLGIIIGTQKQSILPGKSNLKGIPLWDNIIPGPLRIVIRGSTNAESPGVAGDVYVTYMDIVVRNE